MSNALQLPKVIEDAVLGLNQAGPLQPSRRSFLKASGERRRYEQRSYGGAYGDAYGGED